eukprot:12428272-Karenia_brevis.AAC.1
MNDDDKEYTGQSVGAYQERIGVLQAARCLVAFGSKEGQVCGDHHHQAFRVKVEPSMSSS